MTDSQIALLDLIKKSLFGVEMNYSDCANWDDIYHEASIQSVLGLISTVIPEEVCLANNRWKECQYKQIARYIQYCYEEKKLVMLLSRFDIPFVILKGNAAACYYASPELRTMGDIDFLVPVEKYEMTKDVLSQSGYEFSSENERHAGFNINGIELELHRTFSYKDINIDEYLTHNIYDSDMCKIADYEFPMLPSKANGLVLLVHICQHLRSGLGLRQVVDWMMYVDRVLNNDFWKNEFEPIARETNLYTLAIVVTRMCKLYLGLSDSITWCDSADPGLCAELMKSLMNSGNFGRNNGSGKSIEAVGTRFKSDGLFRWLQIAGEHNWILYHRYHWLKPFCWIYQIFRYARQGFKTGRNRKQLSDDLSRSEQRYELLKKLGIE